MSTRVAINGFGRVGRAAFRAAYESDADIEWVAVNDVAGADALANVLARDSVYGEFPGDGRGAATARSSSTATSSPFFAEPDPAALPWGELGVDVVLECTGRFRTRADAAKHLAAGARKVIVSAPMKDADATVVLGVNFPEAYDADAARGVSNASCTTNCLAPGREGAPRDRRHPPRADDDDPRVHRRPAARRHAAQGSASCARGRLATSCRPRPERRRRSAS